MVPCRDVSSSGRRRHRLGRQYRLTRESRIRQVPVRGLARHVLRCRATCGRREVCQCRLAVRPDHQRRRSIYPIQQILGQASISTTEICLDFMTPKEKESSVLAHIRRSLDLLMTAEVDFKFYLTPNRARTKFLGRQSAFARKARKTLAEAVRSAKENKTGNVTEDVTAITVSVLNAPKSSTEKS